MWLHWKDIEIAQRPGETKFSFCEREGGALVEGVLQLRYLGHTLDQTDDDWTEIRHNIKRERKV